MRPLVAVSRAGGNQAGQSAALDALVAEAVLRRMRQRRPILPALARSALPYTGVWRMRAGERRHARHDVATGV